MLIEILVVEDDGLMQHFVEETLGGGGYKVTVVSSGDGAIKLLDAENSTVRALVTDVNLPPGKTTGWEVAKHARELSATIPVIYMTGENAAGWAANGVPNSILLTKPFAPAQLLTAVSQLLNADTPPAAG
jgi:CheY-like chemotaxis protein